MRRTKLMILLMAGFVPILAILTPADLAFAAAQEQVLYSFHSNGDGAWPYAGIIFRGSGKMYGTTVVGGAYGYGAVFQLTLARDSGKTTEKVLHSFKNDGQDGYWPYGGLIASDKGKLYGTTSRGGRYDQGTVFELVPGPVGEWTERVLYDFAGGNDGATPDDSLILDSTGNLYGTTYEGGGSGCQGIGCGIVFKLTPGANNQWTEGILHIFQDDGQDGFHPYAGLVSDAAGNLYGATVYGPQFDYGNYYYGAGIVFQLTPGANGSWGETILYAFCALTGCADGNNPYAGLIFDAAGNLYGTTWYGGNETGGGSQGTVFQLAPGAGGHWSEKVLYAFCPVLGCADGANPEAGLVFDSAGNLYGTTSQAGALGCGGLGCGTVFQLAPGTNGTWTQRLLFSFAGENGGVPYGPLVFSSAGDLYGTTTGGGLYGNGVVFKITP